MDLIIIRKYGDLLNTCDLQCGFKENSSTNTCTFMVKETIEYYINNNSNIYAAVLDATKAFDRIEYCKLFKEFIDRMLPPLVIRLLIEMYTKQNMTVKWNILYIC